MYFKDLTWHESMAAVFMDFRVEEIGKENESMMLLEETYESLEYETADSRSGETKQNWKKDFGERLNKKWHQIARGDKGRFKD